MAEFRSRLNINRYQLAVIFVLMTLFSVLGGIAISLELYVFGAVVISIIPAIYLLTRPELALVFFAVLTLLVSGTLKYFFNLGQFQWMLSALGVLLLAYALVNKLFSKSNTYIPASGIELMLLLWWAGLIFSSLTNVIPVLDWLVGLRIYLPVFGIFAYVAYCRPSEKLLKKIFLFMFAIASIQWLFCLYQKLKIVPARIAMHYPGSAWDSIVGTFGGDKFGGGESGSLGIYLVIIFVFIIALRKYNQIRLLTFYVVLLSSFAAMILSESKVIALLVPLGAFLIFRNYVFKRPVKFFLGAALVISLMFGLLIVYYYLYWQTDNNLGLIDALYGRLTYSFDPYFQATTTNLGRIKSLIFWWDKQSILESPLTLLFGNGLSSSVSNSSIIGEGVAVQRYGYMLDVTGISKLLWESGVIGTLVFLLSFVFGFLRANSLKNTLSLPPWHRATMAGVEVAMVLMPLSIFYEVTVVGSPPMQFMAMFLLGYIVYWWRESVGVRH